MGLKDKVANLSIGLGLAGIVSVPIMYFCGVIDSSNENAMFLYFLPAITGVPALVNGLYQKREIKAEEEWLRKEKNRLYEGEDHLDDRS